jgi:hypothetical protein
LEQRDQEGLISLDETCLARRVRQLAQATGELEALNSLRLQALDKLQPPHQAQPFGFHIRWSGPPPMLCVEAADPGLVKLRRFTQEPLFGERLAI